LILGTVADERLSAIALDAARNIGRGARPKDCAASIGCGSPRRRRKLLRGGHAPAKSPECTESLIARHDNMIIEMKAPGGFPFQLSKIRGDIGGKQRYVLGPNEHAAVYELSTDIEYESGPWLEKRNFFKFSRDNLMAECTLILPWRNVERKLDISEVDGFFSYRLNSVVISQCRWSVKDFCVQKARRFFPATAWIYP
jgi:hypothetical protein